MGDQRMTEEAIKVFMNADPNEEVFVSITQKEACFIHLTSVIACNALHRTSELSKRFGGEVASRAHELEMEAILTDVKLWGKLMNAIRVQVFNEDPKELPDLPDLDELT